MPVIARFYGIVIKMYFLAGEHNPPHFHAIYGDSVGVFSISPLKLIEGDMPVRAKAMVLEWAAEHASELMEMWEAQEFKPLPPLV